MRRWVWLSDKIRRHRRPRGEKCGCRWRVYQYYIDIVKWDFILHGISLMDKSHYIFYSSYPLYCDVVSQRSAFSAMPSYKYVDVCHIMNEITCCAMIISSIASNYAHLPLRRLLFFPENTHTRDVNQRERRKTGPDSMNKTTTGEASCETRTLEYCIHTL